jgi:LacI family transcriptional regulator
MALQMKKPTPSQGTWRIAAVWPENWMQAQETFHALCRSVDLAAGITLRRFEATDIADFQRDVVRPVKAWAPHGVVVRLLNPAHLKALRRQVPGVPFVSTLVPPPGLVDACVVTDIAEAIALARDHYRERGLPHMALFCCASPHAAAGRAAAFRAVVPDGLELICERGDTRAGRKIVDQWLKALPKPVGVIATESRAAGFLLQCCLPLGLRVPQDVQIIGTDDSDECLACEPHLTSIALPSRRIGEVAVETMGRLLRQERPPPFIPVSGCSLVVRNSTGLVSVGESARTVTSKHMQALACKGVPVADLAKMSGVGRATFYRHFSVTGETPSHQMRQLRLQEACRMLRETSATLTTIATACGYSNAFSFSRFFRRETGESPATYRKRSAAAPPRPDPLPSR